MTNPSGPFEYSDDSVVARVSVDIPNQAVTDISQLTSAMSAMRTELEAIARAQSSWLDYLQQMPTIVEQSNQALRNQITLMERMSYLQGEIGPTGGGDGPSFSGGGAGSREGGGGAAGAYSTAAPAGYRNPFEGMGEGLGRAGGGGEAAAMEAMQAAGIDPRAYANAAAARGLPINPAILGAIGATALGAKGVIGETGGGGGNSERMGSQSPQDGNAERTAGGAPNQNERGQATDSEPQDEPGRSADSAGPMQKAIDAAKEGIQNGIGSGILGKGVGMLGKQFGESKALKGVGLLGAGLVGAHQLQNIGESITEYQQLGSVRGGDYATGLKMELENRIRALDPFVNLPQTREAMQAAYGAGFYGKDVAEVQSMAITNFKELGVSMQDTARMMQYALQGTNSKEEPGAVLEERTKIDAVLNTMKELSADGGASFPERQKQLQAALGSLVAMGMDPATVERGQLELQEGYGDERALKDTIGGISQDVMRSPTLATMAGQRLGITGVPGALPAKFAKAGITDAQVLEIAAGEMARAVQGIAGYEDKIALFQELMNQQISNPISYETAEALYKKVTGKKAPTEIAAEKMESQATEKNQQKGWNPITGIADTLAPIMNARTIEDFKNLPGDVVDGFMGWNKPSVNAQRANELFANDRPSNQFAPSGSNQVNLPTSAAQMPASVNTQGQVTGNITITVNQNGTVSAPQSIQLTGTQKSALTGWGSSQMNNLSPGESHAIPPFGGG